MGIFRKKSEEQIRTEKLKELERTLKKLLTKLVKNGSAKQTLWKIILDKNLELPLRTIAVNQFLKQKDLTPADLESLFLELGGNDFVPEKEIVRKRFRKIAASNDIYDAIMCPDEYLSQLGWTEFLYRTQKELIKKELIRKDYIKWVLVQTIKQKSELRAPAWEIFKQLIEKDPTLEDVKDLQTIIVLPANYSIPDIIAEAQTFVRKIQERFAKAQESNKTIVKIQKVIQEIQELKKQELKKEQE